MEQAIEATSSKPFRHVSCGWRAGMLGVTRRRCLQKLKIARMMEHLFSSLYTIAITLDELSSPKKHDMIMR